jgi:Circadian oscillating protein COP23
MKTYLKILSWAILGAMLTSTTAGAQVGPPTPKTSVPSGGAQARFMCESFNNQYMVTYHPVDRPGDKYPWAVPTTMGTWDANKRCTEIARRLEDYRKDGLQELRTDAKNGYDTVCVTTEKNSECRIVFTVPKGQDAIATRDSVFSNLSMADSGQQTTGVNTFTESGNTNLGGILGNTNNIPGVGSIGGNTPTSSSPQNKGSINLRPFLSTNDGGTATGFSRLTIISPTTATKKVSTPEKIKPNNTKMLNPDRFR